MKRISFLLVLCLAVLASCGREPLLEIYPEQLHFFSEGGVETIEITASDSWNTITETEDAASSYYVLTPSSGKGSTRVKITVMPNPDTFGRSDQVLFICSTHDRSVTRVLRIRQDGAEGR